MEYLIAAQDVLVAAAADLEGIGSALAAANRAAEAPTTGLLAAGGGGGLAGLAALVFGEAPGHPTVEATAAGCLSPGLWGLGVGGGAVVGG
ncbi:PE domain-containing protein, partial [Mycobacterium tuberculosis]|uniref:PE domain-containing protein n=1 Tax=Mycobacterium tuberculosis TaxID=1773 RepID=UPI001F35C7D3